MFRCRSCKKVSQPREKMIKQVVEKRTRVYYDSEGNSSVGWEIVREIGTCHDCVRNFQN